MGDAVGLIVAALLSLAWSALAIQIGPRMGWVDAPDDGVELKVHERPAVPLGGVGIFLAVHAVLVVSERFDTGLFLRPVRRGSLAGFGAIRRGLRGRLGGTLGFSLRR